MTPQPAAAPASLFRLRIVLLSALLILTNVSGNFSLSVGVKAAQAGSHFFLLNYFLQPTLVLGVALLISALFVRLALLSAAEMSLILPLNAGLGYILTTIAGVVGLKETVHSVNNLGLALVVAGVLLIGVSARSRHVPGESR